MANFNRRGFFKRKSSGTNPNLVSSAINYNVSPKFGYVGFKLYFQREEEEFVNKVLKATNKFKIFFKEKLGEYDLPTIQEQRWFYVDYKVLLEQNFWDNFTSDIRNDTEFCLACISLAMHQLVVDSCSDNTNLGIIRSRLKGLDKTHAIKDIRVDCLNKLMSIKGTVIKSTNDKLQTENGTFSCSRCTGTQVIKQIDGCFTPPTKCATVGCKATYNFNFIHCSQFTSCVNWKRIKIQEVISTEELLTSGCVPRTLDCELTEDLVNSCIPGDDVTITGVIKMKNKPELFKNQKQNAVSVLYLDVNSVVNTRNQSYGPLESITFNTNDYYAIQAIHDEPNLFTFLVHSLCPKIYGHELVKAGLLLALFGGTPGDDNRAQSHVMVIGDPGLGKSQMLQACANVAPRGVYVCGQTTSGAGLTVTLNRESGGEYSLEAGALMLADQGCCGIDEFDKIPTQHAYLLEAMEQQSVSIAKAGIVCSLPTRATILAAANPVGGHYNKAKTVSENLKISSPMLSRFDLIFILMDQSNEDFDKRLSAHVLNFHAGKMGTSLQSRKTLDQSLKGRLVPEEEIDPLPHSLFRKYIVYAQKYVAPRLSTEAEEVLSEYYYKLRKQFQNGDSTPITTRQLSSLIRLTQARAKLELREEATKADAEDVVEIMKECLIDVFTDEVGKLDTTRSQCGTGMSSKNKVSKLLQVLQRRSESDSNSIFTRKEIQELSEEVGIERSKFFTVLDTLNNQGYLLSKGYNRYQLVTAIL